MKYKIGQKIKDGSNTVYEITEIRYKKCREYLCQRLRDNQSKWIEEELIDEYCEIVG